MVAPAGATKEAIFSETPSSFSRFSTLAGIESTEDWVVNPLAWTEKFFLKNLNELSPAKILSKAPQEDFLILAKLQNYFFLASYFDNYLRKLYYFLQE